MDNASLNLSGQQTAGTLAGAEPVDRPAGGFGAATITQRQRRHDRQPGVGGGQPEPRRHAANFGGGTGVLTVSNSQINITAAPGQATVRIGYDGNGIATFTGSTLNVGNADGERSPTARW